MFMDGFCGVCACGNAAGIGQPEIIRILVCRSEDDERGQEVEGNEKRSVIFPILFHLFRHRTNKCGDKSDSVDLHPLMNSSEYE